MGGIVAPGDVIKMQNIFKIARIYQVAEDRELKGFGRELIWTRNINSISICRIAKGRGIRQVQRPG